MRWSVLSVADALVFPENEGENGGSVGSGSRATTVKGTMASATPITTTPMKRLRVFMVRA